jgi:hypothetical protein
VYGGGFSLITEVCEICGPLAKRITSEIESPAVLWPRLDNLLDNLHELVTTAGGMAARGNGADTLTADLLQRPEPPTFGDAQLCDGTWPTVLGAYVEPFSGPLSVTLRTAAPPADPRLRGLLSASERLESVLHGLDHAASRLERSIGPTSRHQKALKERDPGHARNGRDRTRARVSGGLS